MAIVSMLYGAGGASSAEDVSYDNTTSGLEADNVQDAIDEVNSNLGVKYNIATTSKNITIPVPSGGASQTLTSNVFTEVGLTRKDTSFYIVQCKVHINSFVQGGLTIANGSYNTQDFMYLNNSVFPNAVAVFYIAKGDNSNITLYNGLGQQYTGTITIRVIEFENFEKN